MTTLKFSRNWNNKLNNRIFTTIREFSQHNDERFKLGAMVEITFKGKVVSHAEIIDITTVNFGIIPKYVRMLDTGYLLDEANQVFMHFTGLNAVDIQRRQMMVVMLKVVKRLEFIPNVHE